MLIKSIFKFYFIIVGLVFCLILFLPIFRFAKINSSNSLVIGNVIILFGYLYIGFKITYLLMQCYCKKIFVLRSSFNWTVLILNWIVGGLIILNQSDSSSELLNANSLMGFGCIIAGFIHLPRFIKLDNDSITIYEEKNKQIQYKDLINIEYKDNVLSFGTKHGNYHFKMINVDSNKISKIRDVIKSRNGDFPNC